MTEADWIKFLLGVIVTMLCTAWAYYQGAKGKQSVAGCTACQDACKMETRVLIDAVKAKQAELERRQDELDEALAKKLDLVFRMLRAAIMHLPIDEREKINIINTRRGDE